MAVSGSDRIGAVLISTGEHFSNHESILFVRQDLLEDFLSKNGFTLILFVWGERRANYKLSNARDLEGDFELKEAIHKQGFVYERGIYRRFL
jgi:hypothetical protein